jgi:pseudaminic acid cytidylyltransferase
LFTDHCGGIEVSELEVQDIDTQTDWQLCELKFKLQRRTPC